MRTPLMPAFTATIIAACTPVDTRDDAPADLMVEIGRMALIQCSARSTDPGS